MVELDLHIKNIQEKLQHLLKQHHALQRENVKLKKDLEKAQQLQNDQQQTILMLKQQVDVLHIGSQSLDETDKLAFSKRIDTYLKEIDKCLALLNT
jgi:regulator of replication initiation timing